MREGFFQIFDSFLLLTPVCQDCWLLYWRIGKSALIVVNTNIINATQIGLNVMIEFFSLVSNLMVFYADYFFEDYLSLAFYIGDTLYRMIIAQHRHTFNL